MGNFFARIACYIGLNSEDECYCIENPEEYECICTLNPEECYIEECGTYEEWYDDPDPDPPEGFSDLVPLGANPNTITVSGVSYAAMMASHVMVIMSDIIKGGGFIGGGPYGISETWAQYDATSQERSQPAIQKA